MRISEYRNGHWGIWIRGVVFTVTREEMEELFDKIGMVLTAMTEEEMDDIFGEVEHGLY